MVGSLILCLLPASYPCLIPGKSLPGTRQLAETAAIAMSSLEAIPGAAVGAVADFVAFHRGSLRGSWKIQPAYTTKCEMRA
ncbi:MAG: hypothetical protein PHY34_00985 [Patescibacteria group bacterium]|nr:hypothetical protein [Patescibacteria group bacterium]